MTILGTTERFRELVAQHLGLHFEDDRLDFLAQVLARRSAHSGTEVYLNQLEGGGPEVAVLASELTVGETYFFRHYAQMRAFAETALPARLTAGQRSLRIVSAGCASGEEAYSLAILVREQLGPSFPVEVRGYDVNGAALQRTARATYSSWALRETPPELKARWFRGGPKEFQLDPAIQQSVKFQERNLAKDQSDLWQADSLDIIFCRNMLMYLKPERARALVARFARALLPGGFLFLGHAENLRGLSEEFELCQSHASFFYQRGPGLWLPPPANQDWAEAITSASRRIQTMAETPSPLPQPEADSLEETHLLLQQERYLEALKLAEQLTPTPEVLLLRALLHSHCGHWSAAITACQDLLQNEQTRSGAHYILGLSHEGLGDPEAAVHHHQLAAHFDPTMAMPRLHLGRLARRAKQCALARRELSQAASLLQNEPSERLRLLGGGFSRQALLAMCRAELKGANP